jgi:ADP-ribose pyrophosphatase YjhB (NUDIX family)
MGKIMSFMRLGTRIAVINDDNQILLSKRGDFSTWALPGGRVDSGELIHESAIREVREETGLDVEIERPIGLYFQQGRKRMNILCRAKLVGGELLGKTDETLDNRFFSPEKLPENLFGKFYIDHAYTNKTHLYTIETPFWELLKLDLKLRWRWIQNLLAGRPEPKFTQFSIKAVGIIRDGDKVLVRNTNLPCVISDGKQSLDEALNQHLQMNANWHWIGLWQDTASDTMEFVFETKRQDKAGDYIAVDKLSCRQQKYLEQSSEKIYLLGT